MAMHETGGGFVPLAAERIAVRKLRRPGRWIFGILIAVGLVLLAQSLVTNPGYQWDVVAKYFTAPSILRGLALTLTLTAVAMVLGILLGILLAVMRLSDNPLARGASTAFITVIRGTPLLVQLFLCYNIAALYPVFSLGIPFGPQLFEVSMNSVMTPVVAAILALSLNEGAYMAEIIRAGLQSVDKGQIEAAKAIGLSPRKTFYRIVMPQVMKLVIPPTGNQLIGMLKMTSIVSIIGLSDLLYSSQTIYLRTYEVIPLLLVASIWYFIVTSILSLIQSRIEKKLGKGVAA
ncbi:amino acid ABC transporter permease [Aureimonas fodinaquatilis]|uniref:Glutamate/aspartate import permease protein GltK n=1 Tax=Aureimonas fodinaquatilis TaxID=2565783 RepID=A0A5B0DYT7_9HYPH|nr:amino acid ABC transporter permease [Aureimonas fodinaquatilis]KAA0970931.1 amino acid ABC transporter permease [Aureimonas fodinaquatilis]